MAPDQPLEPPRSESAALPRLPNPPKVYSSHELLGNDQEVLIQHGDQVYRLRRTKQDKLILQK